MPTPPSYLPPPHPPQNTFPDPSKGYLKNLQLSSGKYPEVCGCFPYPLKDLRGSFPYYFAFALRRGPTYNDASGLTNKNVDS